MPGAGSLPSSPPGSPTGAWTSPCPCPLSSSDGSPVKWNASPVSLSDSTLPSTSSLNSPISQSPRFGNLSLLHVSHALVPVFSLNIWFSRRHGRLSTHPCHYDTGFFFVVVQLPTSSTRQPVFWAGLVCSLSSHLQHSQMGCALSFPAANRLIRLLANLCLFSFPQTYSKFFEETDPILYLTFLSPYGT